MNQEARREIKRELNRRLDDVRQELGQVGMTLRNLPRGCDTGYAEGIAVETLLDNTRWDGWEEYDEIVGSDLFQKAVRCQAAFNTLGF